MVDEYGDECESEDKRSGSVRDNHRAGGAIVVADHTDNDMYDDGYDDDEAYGDDVDDMIGSEFDEYSSTMDGGSSMMMDAGQVIIEPDASTMETFCKILASCSPGAASSSTTATSSSSGMNTGGGGTSSGSSAGGGGGGKMSYLERLQTMLYAIQVQDRERRRNESFESFLSAHLPN